MRYYEQCEGASLDYELDMEDFIGQSSISTSTWDADGLTVDDEGITTTTTWCKLSGSTDGRTYQVKNTVTLDDGQIDCFSFTVYGVEHKR